MSQPDGKRKFHALDRHTLWPHRDREKHKERTTSMLSRASIRSRAALPARSEILPKALRADSLCCCMAVAEAPR